MKRSRRGCRRRDRFRDRLWRIERAREAADIVKVVTFLRDDPNCQFWNFIDVTAVDWPPREQRFDVVYHFLSPKQNAACA